MSLRYLLGLYKLHSLFVESELLTEEPKENLIDTKSAEKTKNIHIEALNKNSEYTSESFRNNLTSIKLALEDDQIKKTELKEIAQALENILANYEKSHESTEKIKAETDQRMKDLESKYKSAESNKKSLESQNKELEAKIKDLEKLLRDDDNVSVMSGKSNVSAIKGSGGPQQKNQKEEEIEKFLAEETQKFDEYEQQLKMKEAELVALQQTLESQSYLIQSKEKEIQQRIDDLRSAPLVILGDHNALKERLADVKGRLFDQYLNESRMNSIDLPQDEFVESLKQETEQFWENVSYETKPSNMKQVIESLKAYETFLVYERAKLEVAEKHLQDEVAAALEEKERFIKESENYTKINEIYAIIKEESDGLDQKREMFNKAKIELNKLVRVLKEVLIKAKLATDNELNQMTYLEIIVKFKKHTTNRDISPRKSKLKTDAQSPKHDADHKSRKSAYFEHPPVKKQDEKEDLSAKYLELEMLKKSLEKEAEILKDEKAFIDKIKEEGGLTAMRDRIKHLEEENGVLKRAQQGIISDNFFDRDRLRNHAVMRDSFYISESPSKREKPNHQLKLAEVFLKWMQYSLSVNEDNKDRESLLRNHLIVWKLSSDIITQYQYYGGSIGLEKSSWLSSKWDDKKRELMKSGRFPFVIQKKLSKNKKEAEVMIFDHERKTYWKSKVANLLNTILRNNRKRTRILMVSAWSRFCFNVAMLKLKATTPKSQAQNPAVQYKFDRTQGLKDPKDAFPLNLSRVPTEKSFDHKVVNLSRRSLDESDVLEESPIEIETTIGDKVVIKKEPKQNLASNQGVAQNRAVTPNARDKTPPKQQPQDKETKKKSTTPVPDKKSSAQNKENKSLTPNKTQTKQSFSTLAGDSKKIKKIRAICKLLIAHTRDSSQRLYKMGMYLYKWKVFCNEVEMQNLMREFQDIDLVLKEKIQRDLAFREQLKHSKNEVDNKVNTLNQFLAQERK